MKNIILIGFMGTGKTSTGKALSSRLGYAFLDLDQAIEAAAGMSIPEMFAQYGEPYFRAQEKEAVRRAAGRHNTVIATGGGTVKDPENRRLLKEAGIVICLTADVDTILARTSRKGQRPVLDGEDQGDRRRAVEQLIEERRGLYDDADLCLDTSEASPLQVADQIIRFLRGRGLLHG
jgi:shikimate kinase